MFLKRLMSPDWIGSPRPDLLNQLAGVTGLGWTVSILGYLGSVMGYWTSVLSRLIVGPRSLLYLGSALFVATLGLDRLQKSAVSSEDGELVSSEN